LNRRGGLNGQGISHTKTVGRLGTKLTTDMPAYSNYIYRDIVPKLIIGYLIKC
jgi:hypothetical protein